MIKQPSLTIHKKKAYAVPQYTFQAIEVALEVAAGVWVEVHQFLGLPGWDLGIYKKSNPGGCPPRRLETRQRLSDYLKLHNERLSEMLRMNFDW